MKFTSLMIVLYATSANAVIEVQVLGQALSDSEALILWSRGPEDAELGFIAEVSDGRKNLQVVVPNPDSTTGFVQIPFGTPGIFSLVALDKAETPLETSGPYSVISNQILPMTPPAASQPSPPSPSPPSPPPSLTSSSSPSQITIDFPGESSMSTTSPSALDSSPTSGAPLIISTTDSSNSSSSTSAFPSSEAAHASSGTSTNIAPIVVGVLIGAIFILLAIAIFLFYYSRWRSNQRMAPSQAYFNRQSRSGPGLIEILKRSMGKAPPRTAMNQRWHTASGEAMKETVRTYSDAKSDSLALDPELGKGYMDTAVRKKERAVIIDRVQRKSSRPTVFKLLAEPRKMKWWKDDKKNPMREASIISFTTVSVPPTESEFGSDSMSASTYGTVIHGRFDRIP